MVIIVLSTYAALGIIWIIISELTIQSDNLFTTLFKYSLCLLFWPLLLFVRVERAIRIGKYLKPHSKWQLIVKNKVVTKEDKKWVNTFSMIAMWYHKKSPWKRAFYFSGGERGIRTPGPVTVNGFQDRRNRPLCHFSATNISDFQKLQAFESKTSKSL